MKMVDKIENLLKDLEGNRTLLKLIKCKDIFKYMGDNNLDWSMEDIGRNQKEDRINSIIKHNPEYITKLKGN
jgi:hypothetical protein